MNRFIVVLFLIVVALCCRSSAQTMSCQFSSGGYEFDLSPLTRLAGPTGFFYVDNEGTPRYYYWSYCQNIESPPKVCSAKQSSALMTFIAYCNEYGNLARDPTLSLFDEDDPVKGVVLKYTSSSYTCGGEGYVTFTINNLCDETVEHEIDTLFGPPDVCDVTVNSRSKYACPLNSHSSSGLSLGSILLIIVFGVVFAYLLIGIIYQAKFKGARGVAMIPNHEFWLDLPAKVKDGFKWIFNKITRKNNYNEIK